MGKASEADQGPPGAIKPMLLLLLLMMMIIFISLHSYLP